MKKGFTIAEALITVLMIVVVFVTIIYGIFGEYFTCHAKAEALGYQCSWGYFQGCVLQKPNGEKVLLEQLREYKE